ncbi:MAG: TIGR00374 family protein [Chloroflexi bacterium]|nr:MAG: TIGR00374 family protein [Chloroflexota bacterium]
MNLATRVANRGRSTGREVGRRLLLASAGILIYPAYRPLFAFVLGVLGAGVLLIQVRPLALRGLMLLERLPLVARFGHSLRAFYESSFRLLRLRPLLLAVGLGTVSWAGEGVAFYLVLIGLGLPPSPTLLFQAVFILAFSTIVGAVSTLPGGLGAAEVSLGAMLQLLVGLERGLAGTATLMIRLGTLWFGVLLGLLMLARYHRRFFG